MRLRWWFGEELQSWVLTVGLSGQDGLGNKVIREENIKGDGSIICVHIEMSKN